MAKHQALTLVGMGLFTLTLAGSAHAGDPAFAKPLAGRWTLSAQETALDGRICTTHARLHGRPVTLKVPPGATAFEALVGIATSRSANLLTVKADTQDRACFPLRAGTAQMVRIPLSGEQTVSLVPDKGSPGIVLCNPTFTR